MYISLSSGYFVAGVTRLSLLVRQVFLEFRNFSRLSSHALLNQNSLKRWVKLDIQFNRSGKSLSKF